MTSPPSRTIPVLLLKTKSHPQDGYEEYFSDLRCARTISSSTTDKDEHPPAESTPIFLPEFVPVLEHQPNTKNLSDLERLLKSGRLSDRYGGMIFTSQRAVEAWAKVVKRVEQADENAEQQGLDSVMQDMRSDVIESSTGSTKMRTSTTGTNATSPLQALLDEDFAFPLYTVGPATSRALNTLVSESSSHHPRSPFSRLRPSTFGEHTGNGDALSQYILHHYNTLHSQRQYTFYEAPRLPFTPLIGPPRGERIDKNDDRLRKKPLLFLVGEQRRDIVPNTLMDKDGRLPPGEKIQVDEVGVYVTATRESFQDDFTGQINLARRQSEQRRYIPVTVVVVFSPQGCEAMLRSLQFLDEEGKLTDLAKDRWETKQPGKDGISTSSADIDPDMQQHSLQRPRRKHSYIIATIGPTTRDHLKNTFGFDADICAATPNPPGVGCGIVAFLKEKSLLG